MKLLQVLSRDSIYFGSTPEGKDAFFDYAVDIITGRNPEYDRSAIKNLFMMREQTLSTGIGDRIAIPHIMYEKCSRQELYIFKLKNPLEFDALDKQPVEIVFMLIGSSKDAPALHMQILAKMGLMLRKPGVIDALRAASTPDDLYGVLQQYD